MIHLFENIPNEFPKLDQIESDLWRLTDTFMVTSKTNLGTYRYIMDKGWVTDLRSGSRACDIIVPKSGNELYNAAILCHDLSYSGWVPKNIADELLRQGIMLAGISEWRANLVNFAVQTFGNSGYYDLDDVMPKPYTENRQYEHFYLDAN